MRHQITCQEFVAALDRWVGQSLTIRLTAEGPVLLAVFHGVLGERSDEKRPALFWPLVAAEPGGHAGPEGGSRAAGQIGWSHLQRPLGRVPAGPASVRDDVAFLRESPLIADDTEIRGFVYDVETHRLSEIA